LRGGAAAARAAAARAKASGGGVDFRLGGRGLAFGCFRGREGSDAGFLRDAGLLRAGLLRGALGGVVSTVKGHSAEQSWARTDVAGARARVKQRRKGRGSARGAAQGRGSLVF